MTQEDSHSGEDAREAEEDEEAAEDAVELNIAPATRTNIPPSSRETLQT